MSELPYHGPEKRRNSESALVLMVEQIHRDVNALDVKLTASLVDHKADMQAMLAQAFPAGDADGHRRHHEASIAAAEKRAKFWSTMYMELAKWGLFGFAGWAAIQLWQSFLQGPTK